MTEPELKSKLLQWLAIKGEADTLEKARIEEGPSDRQKKEIRQERKDAPMGPTGTNEQFNSKGKSTPIGMMQRWANVRKLKAAPKPNLPKSELDKADAATNKKATLEQGRMQSTKLALKNKFALKDTSAKKPLDKGSTAVLAASEKLDKNDYLKNMMKQLRQQKGLPAKPEAGSTLDYSKMKTSNTDGIIQGQKTGVMIPVTGPKTNKLFDPQMSGKVKKNAQPAAVSEPTIMNDVVRDNPKEINAPVTVNAYKDKK